MKAIAGLPVITPALWMHTVSQAGRTRPVAAGIEAVVRLYAPDAVLVPTTGKRILQGHTQIRRYFENFLDKEWFHGSVDEVIEQRSFSSGTTMSSGFYTFQWGEHGPGLPFLGSAAPGTGRQEKVRARFTFVFEWTPRGMWIKTHHSSVIP